MFERIFGSSNSASSSASCDLTIEAGRQTAVTRMINTKKFDEATARAVFEALPTEDWKTNLTNTRNLESMNSRFPKEVAKLACSWMEEKLNKGQPVPQHIAFLVKMHEAPNFQLSLAGIQAVLMLPNVANRDTASREIVAKMQEFIFTSIMKPDSGDHQKQVLAKPIGTLISLCESSDPVLRLEARAAVERMLCFKKDQDDAEYALRALMIKTADNLSSTQDKDPASPLQKVARLSVDSEIVPVWEEHVVVETIPEVIDLDVHIQGDRLAGLPDVAALRTKIIQQGGVDPLKIINDFPTIDPNMSREETEKEAEELYERAGSQLNQLMQTDLAEDYIKCFLLLSESLSSHDRKNIARDFVIQLTEATKTSMQWCPERVVKLANEFYTLARQPDRLPFLEELTTFQQSGKFRPDRNPSETLLDPPPTYYKSEGYEKWVSEVRTRNIPEQVSAFLQELQSRRELDRRGAKELLETFRSDRDEVIQQAHGLVNEAFTKKTGLGEFDPLILIIANLKCEEKDPLRGAIEQELNENFYVESALQGRPEAANLLRMLHIPELSTLGNSYEHPVSVYKAYGYDQRESIGRDIKLFARQKDKKVLVTGMHYRSHFTTLVCVKDKDNKVRACILDSLESKNMPQDELNKYVDSLTKGDNPTLESLDFVGKRLQFGLGSKDAPKERSAVMMNSCGVFSLMVNDWLRSVGNSVNPEDEQLLDSGQPKQLVDRFVEDWLKRDEQDRGTENYFHRMMAFNSVLNHSREMLTH